MNLDRRNFIKTAAVMTTAFLAVPSAFSQHKQKKSSSKMKLSWAPYDLELRHTFTISGFSRKKTPVVLTKL
ncbi:MAG TPA: dipeptide epimerase, partial [Porphyromonadaceae bacterium]|nr:dipeptide epimerase [Porphyromonadaceae bacterium]